MKPETQAAFLAAHAALKEEQAKPVPDAAKVQGLVAAATAIAVQAKTEEGKMSATVAQPSYPVGAVATFGNKQVTILKAWQDGQGAWHYQINAKLGMPFGLGDGIHSVSEEYMREKIAGELGALAPRQVLAKGMTVMREGKGGTVDGVTVAADGGVSYQLRGWSGPVKQDDLLKLMRG